MTKHVSTYPLTAIIMIGLSILIVLVLLVTDRGDLTSATLFLVAFACFVSGLFIFAFQREEVVNLTLAVPLVIPYTSTLSRIFADLGVIGHAHFIPIPEEDTFPAPVMQFNPVGGTIPERITEDRTFYIDENNPGVLTVPSGVPLFLTLTRDRAFIIPSDESQLIEAIREMNEDLLEVTEKLTLTRSGDKIVIELKNFLLLEGCKIIQDESPRNCVTAPCPICSFIGIMLAKGLDSPVTTDLFTVTGDTLTIRFMQSRVEAGAASSTAKDNRIDPYPLR
jgi:hypothetical protein